MWLSGNHKSVTRQKFLQFCHFCKFFTWNIPNSNFAKGSCHAITDTFVSCKRLSLYFVPFCFCLLIIPVFNLIGANILQMKFPPSKNASMTTTVNTIHFSKGYCHYWDEKRHFWENKCFESGHFYCIFTLMALKMHNKFSFKCSPYFSSVSKLGFET